MIGNKTLRDLWEEAASTFGDELFLLFEDCQEQTAQFTYGAFHADMNRTSNLFLQLGIQKGDHVAVHMRNSPEFLLCWFGLAQIGAVTVPINIHYKEIELRYILKKCKVAAVVVAPEYLPVYQPIQDLGPAHIIIARGVPESDAVLDFAAMLRAQPPLLLARPPLSGDDPSEVLFTSGTTATPKGVVMTHCNALLAGVVHAWQCGLRRGERFFTAMPCFHIDFQFMAVMSALSVGGTVVIAEHYSAHKFWSQVCLYKAVVTDTMPLMIRTMMMQPREEWELRHQVRQVYFSMGMSTREKEAFEARFQVRLLNCYGSTETVSCVTGDPEHGPRRWPSVGRAALGYELRIMDAQGVEVPAGTVGEIQVHGVPGRTLMKEYFDNPEATARVLSPDGWFCTGDKGYLDEDGWLYFVDRSSNIMKRSGENISCLEVENVLTAHPGIREAAVFGIPDPMRGQAVKAVVCLEEGTLLTLEEISDYCRTHLADFKAPTVVEICKDYPRTCTGKIQKNLLYQPSNEQRAGVNPFG